MNLLRNALIAIALLSSVLALAREGECSLCTKEYAACLRNAGGIAYAVQSCQVEEEQRQEARLNAAYRSALRKLSPERQAELREVQKIWLHLRTKNERFLIGQGLSGHKIAASRYFLELTAQRVADLRTIEE